MTLEERAKEFVSKIASGTSQEMDYYANFLVEFANETTKELQEDLKHKKIAIQNRKARIKKLETQVEKMKCCENCKCYKPCITCNESIGNNCDYYSGGNVCNNWKLN